MNKESLKMAENERELKKIYQILLIKNKEIINFFLIHTKKDD
jgi:hypothetical protein